MSATIIPTRFVLRRHPAAWWAANNPVPLDGEPCLETDTGFRKLGNGVSDWNSLLYQLSGPAYDFGNLADGDTPIWDKANKRWTHGPGGKVYQAGIGISIADPATATPTINSTLGSIALSGYPATYSALPSDLGPLDAGKAYMVTTDKLIYIWNGSAFPADHAGVNLNPYGYIDGGADPNWSNVVSLFQYLPGDPSPYIDRVAGVTWAGSTGGSTVVAPVGFGVATVANGSGYVSTSGNIASFGSGDFTVEALYVPLTQTQYPAIVSRSDAVNGYSFSIYRDNGSPGFIVNRGHGTEVSAPIGIAEVPRKINHVVMERAGGTIKTFMNGAPGATRSIGAATADVGTLAIGGEPYKTFSMSLNICAVRITKGVARYSAAFTPTYLPFPTHG